jgi:hypothetical protein
VYPGALAECLALAHWLCSCGVRACVWRRVLCRFSAVAVTLLSPLLKWAVLKRYERRQDGCLRTFPLPLVRHLRSFLVLRNRKAEPAALSFALN